MRFVVSKGLLGFVASDFEEPFFGLEFAKGAFMVNQASVFIPI
jgi:hypothetical protein